VENREWLDFTDSPKAQNYFPLVSDSKQFIARIMAVCIDTYEFHLCASACFNACDTHHVNRLQLFKAVALALQRHL
jgi:hypothetical protein